MQEQKNLTSTDLVAQTSTWIAYCLIGVYALALFIVLGVAAWGHFRGAADNQVWVDLLKNALAAWGALLTAVIGYFFGSRGTERALQDAAAARDEVEQTAKKTLSLEAQLTEVEAPTTDESSLVTAPSPDGAEELP